MPYLLVILPIWFWAFTRLAMFSPNNNLVVFSSFCPLRLGTLPGILAVVVGCVHRHSDKFFFRYVLVFIMASAMCLAGMGARAALLCTDLSFISRLLITLGRPTNTSGFKSTLWQSTLAGGWYLERMLFRTFGSRPPRHIVFAMPSNSYSTGDPSSSA